MARLISLLMMLALVLTNGASVAAAVCQHADGRAHAAAIASADEEAAAEARGEEAAAKAAMRKGTLADAAAVQLAGFMLPPQVSLRAPERSEALAHTRADRRAPANRAIRPLLEPPSA
jgi:hypothetical protein